MSKFKSFASQASLGDYLIQAPDETAKIKEETARTIRGRERAEQFRQGNAALYLQAQKLAQQQEQMSREVNFQLESENRKAYRDALDRDFNIQTQNDKVRTAQQQQTFKDLSAFSKTAADLFVEVNTKITENQTNNNTVNTLLAGTTFEENFAIQGMVSNLTEAEFAQQSFIKKLVAEGKDVKALWSLYKNRNTRGFIENAGVIQNTAARATPFLQRTLANLDPNLNLEQKRLQVETAWREWLATSFKDANGKQLNPKLVANIGAPIYSKAYTNVMSEFDKLEAAENKKNLLLDTYKLYDQLRTEGVPAVLAKFQESIQLNSDRARTEFAGWIVQGLKNGTITPDEAEQYYTQTFPNPGVNGKETSWVTQYPSDSNIGVIRSAQRKMRSENITAAKNERFEIHQRFEGEANSVYETVTADKNFTNQEYSDFAEWVRENAPADYNTEDLLKKAAKQVDDVRQQAVVRAQLQQELERGTLSFERLDDPDVSFKLKEEFLPKVDKQFAVLKSDYYKEAVNLIKAEISGDPRLVPPPGGNKISRRTLQYQNEQVEDFRKLVIDNDVSLAELPDIVKGKLAAIQAKKNLQGSFVNGDYSDSVLRNPGSINNYKKLLESKIRFRNGLKEKTFRTDPAVALSAYGIPEFNEAYTSAVRDGIITDDLRNKAAEARMSPLDLLNHAGAAANKPPVTLDTLTEAVQKRIPPPAARLLNAYPGYENIRERVSHQMNGTLSTTAPVRGRFNVVQYVSNDPRFKDRTFGPIVYDEHGHGGKNMHVHYEFATQEEALAAKALYESKGFRISSFMRPEDTDSAHSKGFAIDVAPPLSLPYNEQAELNWIRSVNAVIGYEPTKVK